VASLAHCAGCLLVVKRSEADRLVRDSALRPNEKLIMLALLCRADNDGCQIPAWRSPSLLAVQRDTSLAHSTVVKTVAHLEMHGWLSRSGQKRGKVQKSARGRSVTVWHLIPAAIPAGCDCPVPDRPSRGQSRTSNRSADGQFNRPDDISVSAAQAQDCTKGVREGAEVEGDGWPEDSVGAEVNSR
jgi:hypothetical protein